MGQETVRQLRGETAVFVTGEAAVEIAPVGQIPAVRDKAVDVDCGCENDRTLQIVGGQPFDQTLDDGSADDLVAVDRGAHEDAGSGLATVQYAQCQRRIKPGDLLAYRDRDGCRASRR